MRVKLARGMTEAMIARSEQQPRPEALRCGGRTCGKVHHKGGSNCGLELVSLIVRYPRMARIGTSPVRHTFYEVR